MVEIEQQALKKQKFGKKVLQMAAKAMTEGGVVRK
jgi:hypothetical protein